MPTFPDLKLAKFGLRAKTSPEKTSNRSWSSTTDHGQPDNNANYFSQPVPEREEGQKKGRVFTMNDVSQHWDASSCWVVVHDQVYDVTQFLREHPGGEDIILEHGGRDATVPFTDVAHTIDAHALLQKYHIGELHENDRVHKKKKKFSTYS